MKTLIKFFNLARYINKKYPFLVCIGGRGIGKTYSVLKYIVENYVPSKKQ